MNIIHENDAEAQVIDAPYKRVIRHISAPWTLGSKHMWLGTTSVEPGFKTNAHFHEDQEEIFYCVSGKGKIRVDDEEADFYPGVVCYVPAGCTHQIVNTGMDILKAVAVVSPPFEVEQFKKDHEIK